MLSELAFPHIRCCLSAIPSDLMKSTVVDESLSSMNQQFCSRENQLLQPFPASSIWPCLLQSHLPEEDGPDPQECQGCIRIADDITIHGHTKAEHDAHLWNLMWVAHNYGLVFNPQKHM